MASKFCIQCGTAMSEGTRFCPSCGAAQEQSAPVQQPQRASAYAPQAVQQQPYQPPQDMAAAKKKRRVPLFLKIGIGLVVLAGLIVGGVVIAAKATLSNLGKADYYEIGSDKIPSMLLALGGDKNRKLTGLSTEASTGGVTNNVYYYSAEGVFDGMELFEYAEYLMENDGFDFLTDGSFSKARGEAVQMGRNSKDAGYMLVLQFDWEPGKYTLTLMRGKGTVNALEGAGASVAPNSPTDTPAVSESTTPATSSTTEAPTPAETSPATVTQTPGSQTARDVDADALMSGGLFRWFASGEYYYAFEMQEQSGTSTMGSFAARGGAIAMTMEMTGQTIRVIHDGDTLYYVSDDDQTAYIVPLTDEYLPETPNLTVTEIVESGMGTLSGYELPYVKFKGGGSGNVITAWFDGANVCAFEFDGDLMIINESSSTAPARMFEIPESYSVADLREAG